MVWAEEPGHIGREEHAYVTGPATANNWLGFGLAALKPVWVQIQISCVYQ